MRMTFGRLVTFLLLTFTTGIGGLLYLGYLGITDRQERNSADPEVRAATREADRRSNRSLPQVFVESRYNMQVGKTEAVKIVLFKTAGGQIFCAFLAGWMIVNVFTAPSHEQAQGAAQARETTQQPATAVEWKATDENGKTCDKIFNKSSKCSCMWGGPAIEPFTGLDLQKSERRQWLRANCQREWLPPQYRADWD
jgi:hypothetical protein